MSPTGMIRTKQERKNPFQFLSYLEWFLLALVLILELLLPAPFLLLQRRPLAIALSIAGFAVLGLKLPKANQTHRVLFTLAQISLILLATILGGFRLFPFLYLILVIRSCLIFPRSGQWIMAGLSFLLYLLTQTYFLSHWAPIGLPERLRPNLWGILLSFTLLYGLCLSFVLLLMNAILSERRSLEQLAIAHDQLRRYAIRIEDQATLQERNRIAREIHDALGHSLTGLNIQLETALKLWPIDPLKAQPFLASAKKLGSSALNDIRSSISLLRSDPIQSGMLSDSIDRLVQTFHATTGVLPDCSLELPASVSGELSTAIYRIVQESLTNICKYSDAKTVHIGLRLVNEPEPTLTLKVQDDGKGFEPSQNTTGFGIQGMRERVLALGGNFQIRSKPNAGCTITASFPLVGQNL